MVSALLLLKKANVVHRDVSLRNILVHVSRSGVITLKLTDFGRACLAAPHPDAEEVQSSRASLMEECWPCYEEVPYAADGLEPLARDPMEAKAWKVYYVWLTDQYRLCDALDHELQFIKCKGDVNGSRYLRLNIMWIECIRFLLMFIACTCVCASVFFFVFFVYVASVCVSACRHVFVCA